VRRRVTRRELGVSRYPGFTDVDGNRPHLGRHSAQIYGGGRLQTQLTQPAGRANENGAGCDISSLTFGVYLVRFVLP
jgi:hypothetical protein